MDHPVANDGAPHAPALAIRSRWLGTLTWLALCLGYSALLAWFALSVQRWFAPLLLFPLLLGVVVGVGISGLSRRCPGQQRTALLLGTVLCALVTFCGQHAIAYGQYRRAYETSQREHPQAAFFREALPGFGPASFGQFLHSQAERGRTASGWTIRGWGCWLLWGLEALLVVAGSLTAVLIAAKKTSTISNPSDK